MEAIKERIIEYWEKRTHDFKEQRLRELSDLKRVRWEEELNKYIPKDRKLRVLDLGCGTGFLAMLFAAKGHQATGIDLTEHMIFHAKETARILGLEAEFLVMDAEQPDLEKESFDVLVTRNLTWLLPNLGSAYKAWYDLLVPGGVLINFDADYCQYTGEEIELPENHAHKNLSDQMLSENNAITMELSAYQEKRPQWDVGLLLEAGFDQIRIDTGIWNRIYREKDEFYNPQKIFTLAAFKKTEQTP